MKCSYCGAEVRDDVPFCSECGRPLTGGEKQPRSAKKAAREDRTVEKPKKKVKWKLIAALALILVILAAAGIGYLRLPAFRVQRALNAQDAAGYAAAAKVYSDEVQGSALQRLLTTMLCKNRMQDAADAYYAGTLSYEEAVAFYTAFTGDSSGKLSGTASELLAAIEADHDAREALAAGDKAMEDGDYEAAMEYYDSIPETASVYAEAQKHRAEAVEQYVTFVCDKADRLIGSGGYESAMKLLNDALKRFPENATLAGKRGTIGAAYEAITLQHVADLVDRWEFEEAIKYLNDALLLMPESQKLAEKIEEVEQAEKDYHDAQNFRSGKTDTEDADEPEETTRPSSTKTP